MESGKWSSQVLFGGDLVLFLAHQRANLGTNNQDLAHKLVGAQYMVVVGKHFLDFCQLWFSGWNPTT